MRHWRIIVGVIAVVSIGIALYYPITYRMAEESNNQDMNELSSMRMRALEAMNTSYPEQIPASEGDTTENFSATEAAAVETAGPPDVINLETPGSTGGQTATEAPKNPEASAPGSEPSEEPELAIASAADAPSAQTEEPVRQTEEPQYPVTRPPERTALSTAEPDEIAVASTPEGPTPTPIDVMDLILDGYGYITPKPKATPVPTRAPTPEPTPTPDRSVRTGAYAYTMKEKIELDEDMILPELKEIYRLNHDLIGWLVIPGTNVDYPVVQTEDNDYYLHRDFYGNDNNNGQIILDTKCDPYTPSYNLILSGHHMNSGSMFGNLPKFRDESYWKEHKLVEFDTLVERNIYVIFAAFYSADYDEDEEGFRYNADIVYKIDADQWLEEIEENKIYDTGIDVEFGDEFITLTTCYRNYHRNGRFVLVGRKLREGEIIE